MAKRKGYKVPATVVTMDDRDKYPVVDGNDVAGSYHIYANEADKFKIPEARRKLGMLVFTTSTGKVWQLVNNPSADITSLSDWEESKILTKKEYDKLVNNSKNTVVAVQRLDVIKVAYNTKISAISLPVAVNVTLGDGSTATYPVVWNTTTYDPVDSGMQIINGDLTLPKDILNPIVNITQHILVGAEHHVIASLLDPTPMDTLAPDYGTPFADINFPPQVKVKYVDGTTGILSVDWSGAKASYSPKSTALQTLMGEIILPDNVSQPPVPIQPTIDIAAMIKPLQIVSDDPIADLPTAVVGKQFNSFKLPDSNTVTLEDGTTTILKIKWSQTSYNPTYIGSQVISGDYIVPDNLLNDANVYPKVNVLVESMPDVCNVVDPTPVSVAAGTALTDIAFPSSVSIDLLYSDSTMKTVSVPVTWDKDSAGYDPTIGGSYYFDGTITLPPNTTNVSKMQPTFEVDLADTIVYYVGSVSPVAVTVDNGTAETDLNKPTEVDITIVGTDGSSVPAKASVVWDTISKPSYDGTTAGNYVYSGTITPIGSSVPNSKGYKASYTVTVKAAPLPVTYTIKADVNAGNQTISEGDVAMHLSPPSTLSVTYSASDGSPDQVVSANIINWDYSQIAKDGKTINKTGEDKTYVITGDIDLTSPGFPSGIANPKNYKARYTVQVIAATYTPTTKDEIVGVKTTFTDINLDYGTTEADLIAALAIYPTADVNVLASDGSTYTRETVTIKWQTSGYNGTPGDYKYSVTGILADISASDSIYNDNGITCQVIVNIGSAPIVKDITSYDVPAAKTVEYGTELKDLGLATSLVAHVNTNGVADGTTNVSVTWDTSSYNADIAGSYSFPGTITSSLTSYNSVPTSVPSYSVTVKAKPVTYTISKTEPSPIGTQSIQEGSDLSDITLPSTVDVIYTSSDGSPDKTVNAKVTWKYDPITSDGSTIKVIGSNQTYTLSGVIDLSTGFPTDITNPSNVTAKYVVNVTAIPVPVTYTITSVVDDPVGSTTVEEGSAVSAITPPSTAKVVYTPSDGSSAITVSANITWAFDTLTTDGTTVKVVGKDQTYHLPGTIDLSTGFPEDTTNPSNIKADYVVNATAKVVAPTDKDEITTVSTVIPDINMDYGTSEADLKTKLAAYPTVDVKVLKSDGTTTTKTGVAVTWNTSSYDGTVSGQTSISGTLADLSSSDSIYNDNGVTATVKVIVGKAPDVKKIVSYVAPDAKTVENGTDISAITLDNTITANITVNGVASTTTFNVTWDTSSYDGTTANTYTFPCTITDDISEYSEKPADLPSYSVTVKAKSVPSTKSYAFSTTYTMPSSATDTITVANCSDLLQIAALGDSAEDAFNGVYDEDADAFDNTRRRAEVRFLGIPTNKIAEPGIRVPCDSSSDEERTAFQNKVNELGLNGACGSIASPISYTWYAGEDDSDSGVRFNTALDQSPIFLIRMCDTASGYIPVPDTENSVL